MNEVLSYIDNFFRGNPGPMQKQEFEKRLKEDPVFAEEVAFYVATINVLKDDAKSERKERFRNFKSEEIGEETSEVTNVKPMRSSRKISWAYSAAASLLILLTVGWFMFGDRATPVEMADRYISTHFQDLGQQMGLQDSIEIGRALFNEGKLDQSLQVFLDIDKRYPDSSDDVKKFIGIVYLRQDQYDKALDYFTQLANMDGLSVNYGPFYKAITLIKRNNPGDSDLAKKLLEQVDDYNLAGSEEARKWLKKF